QRENADLVLGTDPDADRVGIAVRDHEGKFILLNGNQTGSLIMYYLLSAWHKAGRITGNEYVVKTIVTTELVREIADSFKVECLDVLTGFKYIGGVMHAREGKKTFIGGMEESYGYLAGEFVRDKDAVISSCMIAETLAWAKSRGGSLFELLLDIYVKYGFYKEKLISITKKGKSGAEEIESMMSGFRERPPEKIAGSKVCLIKDYLSLRERNIDTGKETPIDLPKSNVIQFFTEDGAKITARPSGTEPKIKFYFSVKASLARREDYEKTNSELDKRIEAVRSSLGIA
ncbi:MAG: phospho-sugar mutase, partial [Candidatus Lokiarchaeota archaeon]|nr:phospho-sugar mutase [Candidatus Lokiarchaeota archaeon]